MAYKVRLIDANALPYENQVLSNDDEWCLKVSDIEKAPTVDAVVVVYCKDCARCKNGHCTIRKDSWGAALEVGLHDFCSDGQRKAV